VAWKTVEGAFSLGDLIVFFTAFYRVQAFLGKFVLGITNLYDSNLFIGNLFQLLDLKPTVRSADGAEGIPMEMDELQLENVSFKYPGSAREALRNVSLTVKPEQHVAIVGQHERHARGH
tara:strand:- start:17050 stop:17406 length:357 start_codon:yes stop_codon:yes gene_type:complete